MSRDIHRELDIIEILEAFDKEALSLLRKRIRVTEGDDSSGSVSDTDAHFQLSGCRTFSDKFARYSDPQDSAHFAQEDLADSIKEHRSEVDGQANGSKDKKETGDLWANCRSISSQTSLCRNTVDQILNRARELWKSSRTQRDLGAKLLNAGICELLDPPGLLRFEQRSNSPGCKRSFPDELENTSLIPNEHTSRPHGLSVPPSQNTVTERGEDKKYLCPYDVEETVNDELWDMCCRPNTDTLGKKIKETKNVSEEVMSAEAVESSEPLAEGKCPVNVMSNDISLKARKSPLVPLTSDVRVQSSSDEASPERRNNARFLRQSKKSESKKPGNVKSDIDRGDNPREINVAETFPEKHKDGRKMVPTEQSPNWICLESFLCQGRLPDPDRTKTSAFTRAMELASDKDTKPTQGAIMEKFEDFVDQFSVNRELDGSCRTQSVTVLIGDDGCGKTTAAGMFCRFILSVHAKEACWTYPETFEHDLERFVEAKRVLFVMDDFLGHHSLDDYGRWKSVIDYLRGDTMTRELSSHRFLLVTRTSVLQAALVSTGTSLTCLVGRGRVLTLPARRRETCEDLLRVDVSESTLNMAPNVGLPLCCKLASHLLPERRDDLFKCPRFVLKHVSRQLIEGSDVAKAALCLLAISEGYVDTTVLLYASKFKGSKYSDILQNLEGECVSFAKAKDIVLFYQNATDLVLVEDEFASFTNGAVRESVLMVLCDSQPEILGRFCSLQIISRLVTLASDEANQADLGDKLLLPEQATSEFLKRVVEELNQENYRYTLPSNLFRHDLFRREFLKIMEDEKLLEKHLESIDNDSIFFMFWVGTDAMMFKKAWSLFANDNEFVTYAGLLGCCYWGLDDEISGLFDALPLELQEQVRKGTISETESLQSSKTAPFYQTDTLLTMAAWRGHDAVVKRLLAIGLSVNMQGNDKQTALMHYCARRSESMVCFLLKMGADPLQKDAYDMTALHYAVYGEEWEIPRQLLTSTAINARNARQESPLLAVCRSGWSVQAVRRFVRAAADVEATDSSSCGCLHAACRTGDVDLLDILLEESSAYVTEESRGRTPLEIALSFPNRRDVIRRLLRIRRVQVQLKCDFKRHFVAACKMSDEGVVKALLDAGSPTPAILNEGLRAACAIGSVRMVRFLLGQGAEPSPSPPKTHPSRSAGGYSSCLRLACRSGSKECVQKLLEKVDKTSLNKVSADGKTPLQEALSRGRLGVAVLLKTAGADYQLNSSRTCLLSACMSDSPRVLDWCKDNLHVEFGQPTWEGEAPFRCAVRLGCRRTAKWLADHGEDTRATDADGETCLFAAAAGGHLDIVQALLAMDNPLDWKATNKQGETALEVARAKGHVHVAEFLENILPSASP